MPGQGVIKLVSVSATFVSIIKASKKVNPIAPKASKLYRVPYIYYPAQYGGFLIEVLIGSNSKVNAMKPGFARKLGFCIYKTNIDAQKIDNNRL